MAKTIKIPESYTLVNTTYSVVFNPRLVAEKSAIGYASYHDGKVELSPDQTRICMEHTFLHELVHTMFAALGWDKMNENEGKVDALAGMIHQFLQTRKGEINP